MAAVDCGVTGVWKAWLSSRREYQNDHEPGSLRELRRPALAILPKVIKNNPEVARYHLKSHQNLLISETPGNK